MDHGRDILDPNKWTWTKPVETWPPIKIVPEEMGGFNPNIDVKDNMTLQEWVKYFENLIKLAKEYDDATGQPECEDVLKKMAIKKIADELGVVINL